MGIPIYMRIQDFIKLKIESGEWEEGAAIPTEAEFSKLFGCSRITVTNALRELVTDGLIYRVQGKGTYVSKHNKVVDLFGKVDLAHTSLSIEAMSISGEHKYVNNSVEEPTLEVANLLNINKEQKVISYERIKFVDDKPFAVEKVYIPELLCSSILDRYSEQDLGSQPISKIMNACGITIGKSYISSKPIICDDKVGELLSVLAGTPILEFCIEIHDLQEKPVAVEFVFTKGELEKVLFT
ncbi:MAG: GntR family transcriptional regulator [Lachnotalea sp.]